jgi:hypothetical protein
MNGFTEEPDPPEQRITDALVFIENFGDIDGAHHKQWVIDRLVHILTGTPEEYEAWVQEFEGIGADPDEIVPWDKGITP